MFVGVFIEKIVEVLFVIQQLSRKEKRTRHVFGEALAA